MLRRAENCQSQAFVWCWPIVGTLILGWLFAAALSGEHILVFRDAAYWHSNTLQWTVETWQNGSIPLWNDLQGLGVNWVGQGTTTVFYPGTWLLVIPAGNFQQRYTFILVLHLMLCGWGTYRFARCLHVQPLGAWLAALTFALSGPVLALHGNWPFLIGAAWLPWAMTGTWHAIVGRRATGQVSAAMAVALMILGGEPQAVLLWGASAVGLLVLQSRQRPDASASTIDRPRIWSQTWSRCQPLLAIGLLAAGASCLQWWPLWESSQASTRVLRDTPNNIYQAAALWQTDAPDWAARTTAGLLGPPQPASQADQALQFSQPPWHWATLFAGNLMGTWRSVHARWDRHLSANDRTWNPTLYASVITAVLVVARGLRWLSIGRRYVVWGRSGRRRWQKWRASRTPTKTDGASDFVANQHLAEVWLWWLLLLFGLGSCGWYGVVWIGTEAQAMLGLPVKTPTLGPQVGGLYWWLTVLCPGFDQFRYPAKLWLMAALAWSLLASFEFGSWFPDGGRVTCGSRCGHWIRTQRRSLLSVTLVLLLLLLGLAVASSQPFVANFFRTFYEVPLDPWLGALQVPQALLELHLSLIQSIVVCSLLGLGLMLRQRRASIGWGWLVVALTVADVTINNAWLVQTIDARVMSDSTPWDLAENPYRSSTAAQPSLAQQRFWYEPQLTQEHRLRQMSEKWGSYWPWQPSEKWTWQAIYSMRATGAPQYHLARRMPSANSEQTLEPIGPTVLRAEVVRQVRALSPESGRVLWRSYLRSLGVRHWLSLDNEQSPPSAGSSLRWTTLPETPPPVWLAEQWEVRPPVPKHASSAERIADLAAIWLNDDIISDSPTRVTLDRDFSATGPASAELSTPGTNGIIDWEFSEQLKTAVVKTDRPVVVVWRQWHDPGWQAIVRTADSSPQWQPTVAVQRIFTGLVLPAGEHQIHLVYFPRWFWLGGLVSLLTWSGLFGWSMANRKL